jgi:RNA polymerase sigma-70 factor (ECF subfamily)
MAPGPSTVTRLIIEWRHGNESALERLMPIVYAELRRMAHRQMRQQRPGHTLQTTALLHEAYLRLAGDPHKALRNRAHFFGLAATAMRHILVDHARTRHREKRGGAYQPVSFDEAVIFTERAAELLALDDALTTLTTLHPRQSRVVEMRYFGGLSVEETAEVLEVSPDTVMRDWRAAKTWLHRELSRGAAPARQGNDS